MTEIRVTRVEHGHTKIRNVPIAVTPEGFWCCPSPVVFQKTFKAQNPRNKSKPSPPPSKTFVQKNQSLLIERKPIPTQSRSGVSNDRRILSSNISGLSLSMITERASKTNTKNLQRKVATEFGEPGTSDLKVVVLGKQGISVKLSVHKNVLIENSSFFADKLSQLAALPCLEIGDCEDVEIFVETVGLMYCKEMKQRLIKQRVPRVLRILKVAELIGFHSCMLSCLEYLEAVPWVGEEEEEKVVSSVLRIRSDSIQVTPVLKRVSSNVNSPNNTLPCIMELVLKSNENRGRHEMKSLVLRLLRENNSLSSNNDSANICNETIYNSCQSCLNSLLHLFRQATKPGFTDNCSMDSKGLLVKQIALEADNLLWLLEILADRQAAEEFALMWASQQQLATLHGNLPTVSRHLVSCITARLFIAIGRGEMLPSKDTRQLLLQTWLQPLIDDYSWLQHGCRSFDRKLVEEGIGRTILTLPLEDQESILLAWLGSFLNAGNNCPNLQRAFEVWWRRTFVRPSVEPHGNLLESDSPMTSK